MHSWPRLLTNRKPIANRSWVWLPVLVCLIVLSVDTLADCNCNESFAYLSSQATSHLTGCLACSRAGIDAAFLFADTAKGATGLRLIFASLAETESPEFNPENVKSKQASDHTSGCHMLISSVQIVLMGAVVPLFLIHKALLC